MSSSIVAPPPDSASSPPALAKHPLASRLVIGWLSVGASFGIAMLWFLTPLGRVLSWEFPNSRWMYSVLRVLSDLELVVSTVVPLVAVLLPPSIAWSRMKKSARRAFVGGWIAWLAVGLPGWIALLVNVARASGDDLGLGLALVIGAPVYLAAVLGISIVALVPRRRSVHT